MTRKGELMMSRTLFAICTIILCTCGTGNARSINHPGYFTSYPSVVEGREVKIGETMEPPIEPSEITTVNPADKTTKLLAAGVSFGMLAIFIRGLAVYIQSNVKGRTKSISYSDAERGIRMAKRNRNGNTLTRANVISKSVLPNGERKEVSASQSDTNADQSPNDSNKIRNEAKKMNMSYIDYLDYIVLNPNAKMTTKKLSSFDDIGKSRTEFEHDGPRRRNQESLPNRSIQMASDNQRPGDYKPQPHNKKCIQTNNSSNQPTKINQRREFVQNKDHADNRQTTDKEAASERQIEMLFSNLERALLSHASYIPSAHDRAARKECLPHRCYVEMDTS
ncbi:unnamed protein product [Owenia fusiformis]|uniref:Uncharacterized protein n=1 Tax=Owenia fusiformis TaxID=6347 RepID=A0A8J1XRQ3_OWEFU|nr:unnamed protein product [Owenia fusiformis]